MGNYIISITVCALAVAFISAATPQNGGINKFISFLSALIITVVILAPLKNEIDFAFDYMVSDADDAVEADYNKLAADSLSCSVADTVESKYKCKVNRILVTIEDDSKFVVEKVEVFLDRNLLDVSVISNELSKLYNCKIIVANGG